MTDTWSQYSYFPSSIYTLEKPEFLQDVSKIAEEYLEDSIKHHDLNEIYPVMHTNNMVDDERLSTFKSYILNTCWNILNNEGYPMDNKRTYFTAMWMQTHYKFSSMERHVHPGCHLVGFYFIESHENGCFPYFHDPRPGKEMLDQPPDFRQEITNATNMIHFKPKPGSFLFADSWLPHSFSRNQSTKPVKFIHFNVVAKDYIVPPQGATVI